MFGQTPLENNAKQNAVAALKFRNYQFLATVGIGFKCFPNKSLSADILITPSPQKGDYY
jgi:hypothetical protein